MKNKSFVLVGFLGVFWGCLPQVGYYLDTNLNSVPIGLTKADFLSTYSGTCTGRPSCNSAVVRAAQKGSDGLLVEVLTLEMLNTSSQKTDYWFVFKNSILVQWGRPEDWQAVAGKYEVSFNPGPSVRR